MTLQVFVVAFIVSFFGSIPPGTINITVMQMGIQAKLRAAYFLVIGATLVEFIYAMLVVRFQIFLNDNITFTHHFTLITAIVLITLGMYSLRSKRSSGAIKAPQEIRGRSGFLKGIILGFLNPLAIPFWLAVTAYLQQHAWIDLTGFGFWAYLSGIFLGSIVVLFLAVRLGNQFTRISDNRWLVQVLPGLVFISLGAYNLFQWASAL